MIGGRVLVAPALVLAALLALGVAISTADPGASVSAKVDPRVEQQIEANGATTFWVVMRERADTSAAPTIQDRPARGRFVFERLKAVADQSQSGLRGLLKRRGVPFKPFFIANVIEVKAGESVLREIAAQPEVSEILADRVYEIPKPDPDEGEPTVNGVEWNIDRIHAPQVWSTFNDRGENIVIASIDTGAQYNHPALVAQYRGNLGGGNFDHNYNWFDPSRVCGNPSLVPCDNNQHGTHTMGTMVGDDGANQFGVAPRARWITAKGCESNYCSLSALLASGQWILAPTDLAGQNPRPDLRPNIVNNSWGGGSGDQWYQQVVSQWGASGIFPVFSNGNDGPSCFSSGSPGDYPSTYSAGAFDINDQIASFSSLGPSEFGGEIKPNIAAPGVSVRSSVPNNSYGVLSGTSMAAPHVAGTVALMWSKSPVLVDDINSTRAILDDTATDVSALACGGTADDNNIFGEGRLDAFAAVDQSPGGPNPGTLQGTVTNASSGAPISGATVRVTGPVTRTTTTNPSGQYSFRLPDGSYDVTASAFGFAAQTATGVAIAAGQVTTQGFALSAAPSHPVSGVVRDNLGNPVANASVTILNTPITPATTSSSGAYSFASVPEGQYDVRSEGGRCTDPQTQQLVVNGNETLNFSLPRRSDGFGYFCGLVTPSYIEAAEVVPLSGDDSTTQVSMPFPFPFYGKLYSTAYLSINGNINFLSRNGAYSNSGLPSTFTPNAAIYANWDDLYVDSQSSVRIDTLGSSPDRRFVIEWRNIRPLSDSTRRYDFEIVLYENGRILMQYRNIDNDAREQGNSVTVGIENEAGTVGFQYSLNEAVLSNSTAIEFRSPPAAFLEGHITDANDGLPLQGGRVSAFQGSTLKRQAISDSTGFYRTQVPLGNYGIQIDRPPNYEVAKQGMSFTVPDVFVTRDYALKTARAETSPSALTMIVPQDQTRHRTLTLNNTGSLSMSWTASDSSGSGFDAPWLVQTPAAGTVAIGGSQTVDVTVDTAGLQPGIYGANIFIDSNSGRKPRLTIPVSLVVPSYYQAVNAGDGIFVDGEGDTWSPDQAYGAGSFGFIGKSKVVSTTADITGTDEDTLYRFTREEMLEYRFDNLPAGVYELDLRFAEISGKPPGKRQFDVIAENQYVLPAHDISLAVGKNAADKEIFYMQVTDGALNLRFVPRKGYGSPTISAVRVRNRPDRGVSSAGPWGF
jgi:subtilisin family serine protease